MRKLHKAKTITDETNLSICSGGSRGHLAADRPRSTETAGAAATYESSPERDLAPSPIPWRATFLPKRITPVTPPPGNMTQSKNVLTYLSPSLT